MEFSRIPGLNFSPTGSELLFYLKQRVLDFFHFGNPNSSTNSHLIPDVELHNWDPVELPGLYSGLSTVRSNGKQWFFFCLRKEKYHNSHREERTVSNVGYWKVTSTDKKVKCEDNREEIGKKKTLTFYRGRMPHGRLTSWGMHEYHLNTSYLELDLEEVPFFVCCVFKRSGRKRVEDDELTSSEEVSSGHASATSEGRAPAYGRASTEDGGMWQSQPEIQQLPLDRTDYNSFTDGAGTSFDGLINCHVSNYNYASQPAENSYHQLCQDDWFSKYY